MAQKLDRHKLQARGLRMLPPHRALAALGRAIQGDLVAPCVVDADWQRYAEQPGTGRGLLSDLVDSAPRAKRAPASSQPVEPLLPQLMAAPSAQRLEIVLDRLQVLARSVLGYGEGDLISKHQPLIEQGFDSLMVVELRNRVAQLAGRRLPVSLIFDHPTLERLAAHLLDQVFDLAEPVPSPAEPALSLESVVARLSRLLDE
jgi:hypothetical protein